jgi:hypothetical protein
LKKKLNNIKYIKKEFSSYYLRWKKEYDNCENENEMKEYKKIKNFCFIKNLKYCFEKK